ncbi:MAG TPA: PepSY domain-containing protein [Allosphingosinicella sp.]|nr:PepSY domain-containing protein [Allosphingosinicella sp.]
MVKATTRRKLRRYHIWLGWIVGLPILFWTVSGLIMVARPIEEVRGEDLIGAAPALGLARPPVPPQIGPRPVASVTLEQQSDGPVWRILYADGAARRADPATGRLLPPLTAADAARIVRARYTGKASIAAVDRTSADKPPLDLRRKVEAWRVTMSDGTRFYLNAATGEIVARRTAFWRFYDLMWGIHIMDPGGREDTHNPWVIGFGLLALVTTILAIIMLPMTIARRRRGK